MCTVLYRHTFGIVGRPQHADERLFTPEAALARAGRLIVSRRAKGAPVTIDVSEDGTTLTVESAGIRWQWMRWE
jgi:hypothetical protein